MEFEIGGNKYRSGKLNAFAQLHVSRKLAPIIVGMAKTAKEFRAIFKVGDNLPEAGTADEVQLYPAFGPIAEAISKMEEADVNEIVKKCLAVCQRYDSKANQWYGVSTGDGHLRYDDIDLRVLIRISVETIKENLGGFFEEGVSESGQA